MAFMLLKVGEFAKKNSVPHNVAVGDISSRHGGQLEGHSSHRNGMDADVAYFFNNLQVQRSLTKALSGGEPKNTWMKSRQWELFKHLVSTQHVDRIFVNVGIKRAMCRVAINNGEVGQSTDSGIAFETLRRLNVEDGHDGHFHLRVKCSENNTKCWQMAPPVATTGCF